MIFKRWDVFLVAFILLSLICAFYAHVIFLDEMFVKRDIGRYYHPLRQLVLRIFESGGFPFWNPYLFCGVPLFATLQSCVLYPPSIIYYLGNFSHMFNLFILFHIFLAGIFMYLLMKELGLSRPASFLASFSFAFSGYMIGAINLTISLTSAAWFPLLLYFYKKTQITTKENTNKYRHIWIILAALTLVMMLLAGDPAIVFISLILLFCVSFYCFLEAAVERKSISLNCFKSFFLVAILFGLLSAFQTVPFLEYLRLTDRKDMAWWVASGWSVPPSDLISLVIPFFNDINWYFGDYWQIQSWLDNYYMGLIALCFCFIGAFFDRSKRARLFVLLSVFSLALVLGRYTAFYALLYKFVPFFKLIRYPVRFFFLYTFCLAALAGMGLDYFRNNIKTDERLKMFSKGLLAISFLSAVLLGFLISFSGTVFVKLWNRILPMMQDYDKTKNIADLYTYIFMDFYNFKRAVALFTIFGLLFFLGTKKHMRTRAISFAFIGIAICDVLATNLKYEATIDIKTYTAPTENIKFLQKDKTLFRVTASPQIGRLHTRLPEKSYYEGVLASKDRLVSNKMMEFGIYDIGGYDSMYLRRQNKLLGEILRLQKPNDARILDMLNVKYICTHKANREREGYRLANKTNVAALFENLNWLPRAYLAEKVIVVKNEDKIIERLKDKTFDPANEVILEEAVNKGPGVKGQGRGTRDEGRGTKDEGRGAEEVGVLSYTPNEVVIKTAIASPKFLVLADSYYPGWKVYIDGAKGKIYRANYTLRAVWLDKPGKHIVRFVYEPVSFRLGIAISLLGIILAISIWKSRFLC